jgi:LCP family protein required for cell wall assembly
MIVLTIDPENNTAGMLSIPRDLWVSIPGYSENRINTAHYTGDLKKYPGGGPALAIKTVQYNLGIPIHYYVRVNFSGFVEAIDTIGGVDIYVEKEIDDPLYPDNAYGYDPLYIPVGLQHMDGELALKYARTRHGGSDFDRLRRQQQVIMAVRDKVLRLGMLPQLLLKLPELLKTVGDSVQTDLQLDEMLNLVQLASQIDDEHIKAAMIDSSMTVPTTTPNGAQVLIPIPDEIRAMVNEIFGEPAQEAEEEIGEDKAKLAEEAAKIIVHNGSTTGNLAAQVSAFLKEHGLQVVEFGNAERFDYPTTIIVDYTGKEYTIQYLARLLNIPQNNIQPFTGSYSEIDIRLVIGADFQLPTSP